MKIKNENEIYPGHGACELCGEIDPCYACVGVPSGGAIKEKVDFWKSLVAFVAKEKDEEQRAD